MKLFLKQLPPNLLFFCQTAQVDLFDAGGLLLLKRGQPLTDWVREQLAKRAVYTLVSEKDHGTTSGVKSFSRDLYWEIVGSMWSIYHEARLITPEQISRTMAGIEGIINEIKDKCIYIDFNSLRVDLKSFQAHDYHTFIHCVNVALLATLTGLELGFQGKALRHLTMGALFHDLGKLKVPRQILTKPGALTEAEFLIIKRHPLEGEAMLKKAEVIPKILNTVRQHHERWAGNGYPHGLKGSEIDLDAQIVAVADVYDALTADRPYRKALPPYHALEMILTSGKDFNPKVVQAFRKVLILYPEDSLVTLNTGEVGVVVAVPASFPTRPLIRLVFDRSGQSLDREMYLDLLSDLTRFISRVEFKQVVV